MFKDLSRSLSFPSSLLSGPPKMFQKQSSPDSFVSQSVWLPLHIFFSVSLTHSSLPVAPQLTTALLFQNLELVWISQWKFRGMRYIHPIFGVSLHDCCQPHCHSHGFCWRDLSLKVLWHWKNVTWVWFVQMQICAEKWLGRNKAEGWQVQMGGQGRGSWSCQEMHCCLLLGRSWQW